MTTTKTRTRTKTSTTRSKIADKPISKLPSNPFAFEVLDLVSKQRTKAKKVEVLREYGDNSLKAILIWNFDDSIISVLPPGEVPYFGDDDKSLSEKIEEAVQQMGDSRSLGVNDKKYTMIRSEYTKFYNFIKGGNDGLSSLRRESIFIQILEGLHPLEAEIICLCKDKNLQSRYKLDKQIVTEAYPDITWGGRS
jgi:hypothetical protein